MYRYLWSLYGNRIDRKLIKKKKKKLLNSIRKCNGCELSINIKTAFGQMNQTSEE
jgi:hypothetical protein